MSTVELNEEELAIIKDKRKKEDFQKEQNRIADLRDYNRMVEKSTTEDALRIDLANKLKEVDTDGIIDIRITHEPVEHKLGDYQKAKVRAIFILNSTEQNVDIGNHVVYNNNRYTYKGNNNGMKYLLNGGYNGFKNRWLKDPKKVLKYIKEFKDEHDRKTSAKAEKESLNDRAFEMMRDDYPNAVVKFSEGYNIGTGKNYRYRPDIISVKTERGEIEFTYQENKHGDIAYSVRNRVITDTDTAIQVQQLILG